MHSHTATSSCQSQHRSRPAMRSRLDFQYYDVDMLARLFFGVCEDGMECGLSYELCGVGCANVRCVRVFSHTASDQEVSILGACLFSFIHSGPSEVEHYI